MVLTCTKEWSYNFAEVLIYIYIFVFFLFSSKFTTNWNMQFMFSSVEKR